MQFESLGFYSFKNYKNETKFLLNKICCFVFVLFLIIFLNDSNALAANGYTTYQARIYKSDNTPLESANVSFVFTVKNPSSTCSLYTELYTAVNMLNSGGLISISLGSGTKTFPTSGTLTYQDVYKNTGTFSCSEGGTYTPTTADVRKIVMQFNDGITSTWQTLPPMQVNSVPYAFSTSLADTATSATTASNALALNGLSSSSFVQVPGTCNSGEVLTYNGASFACSAVSGGSGSVTITSTNSYLTVAGTASAPTLTVNVGTTTNTVAAGNDSRITGALQKASNLSDLASSSTARTNLGLGTAATQNVGTSANNVVQLTAASKLPAVDGSLLTNLSRSQLASGTANHVLINDSSGNMSSEAQLAVTRGGTGASSFTGNSLVMTNSGGTAFTSLTCTTSQIPQYNGSSWACANMNTSVTSAAVISALGYTPVASSSASVIEALGYTPAVSAAYVTSSTAFVQNGNAFGASAVLGTTDAQALQFMTNNSARMTISNTGAVGIGITSPNASSLVDITSTTKGLLIPRMTQAQRDAISSPATGLQVYNTDANTFDYYNGSAWSSLGVAGSGLSSLNGLTTSTQTFAIGTSGTSPAFSSATSTHTLNIPLASATGVTAGLLSKADYDKFTNKLDATNAAVVSALGYTPVASSSASVIAALGYTPAASGSVAVTSASVISALGYTPSQSGATIARSQIASGTANYVLINDASGNVSSEAQLAVSRGGTGASSFTANSIVMTNGTGSALTSASCSVGEVLQYSGTSWACTSMSSATSGTGYVTSATAFVQGGNAFGATGTLGTTDAQSLQFITNNSARMTISNAGAIGIGIATPSASSLLEVSSTTKGILIPRMTSTQRDAIASPGTGLQIYNTTANTLDYYNGSAWTSLSTGSVTSSSIITALGYTPVAATSSSVISALGYTPVASSSASVIQALGYTPAASGSVATVTSASVISALGYTPAASGSYITSATAFVQGGNNFGTSATVGLVRNMASDSDGQALTVAAAGASVGGSNRNGGDLILKSGVSTGYGWSQIQFQVPNYAAASTADNNFLTMMNISGSGVGLGTDTPLYDLHVLYDRSNMTTIGIENNGSSAAAGTALVLKSSNGTAGVYNYSGGYADTTRAYSTEIVNNSTVGNLLLSTSGTVRMKIQAAGTVVLKGATANSTSTIDFSAGNLQYTNSNCGSFQFNNMSDGAQYTFIVKGATSATCSFTMYSDAGTTALTVHMPPSHGSTIANTHTMYSFIVAGTDVYVGWVPGY